jgi:hypothetical protein
MTPQNTITETFDSFLLESIGIFIDSCEMNPLNALRSLQRIRQEWPETKENRDSRTTILSNINAIESLIIDIAEAKAQRTQMILNQYEQVQE